ncbi:MAG: hypothetical protein GWP59_03340 [Chlamydiales bacterium]|nr:hypothetical protein [Chlamydiales bacterium]
MLTEDLSSAPLSSTAPRLSPSCLDSSERHIGVAIQKVAKALFIAKGHSLRNETLFYSQFCQRIRLKLIPTYRKLYQVSKSGSLLADFTHKLIFKAHCIARGHLRFNTKVESSQLSFQLLSQNIPTSTKSISQKIGVLASAKVKLVDLTEKKDADSVQDFVKILSTLSEELPSSNAQSLQIKKQLKQLKKIEKKLLQKCRKSIGKSKAIPASMKKAIYSKVSKLLKIYTQSLVKNLVEHFFTKNGEFLKEKAFQEASELQKQIAFTVYAFKTGKKLAKEIETLHDIMEGKKPVKSSSIFKYAVKSMADSLQSYLSGELAGILSKHILSILSEHANRSLAESPALTLFIENLLDKSLQQIRETTGLDKLLKKELIKLDVVK